MNNLQIQNNIWERGEKIWDASFLSTYPITMTLGIILSILTIIFFWYRMKYSWNILQIIIIIIIPSAILGARFWFLISEGGWDNWYKFSGLSIQGGVAGASIAVIPYLWFKRTIVDIRIVVSIILPSILIGQGIGRWGNFANHEVFGKVVDGDSLNWMGSLKNHMLIGTVKGASNANFTPVLSGIGVDHITGNSNGLIYDYAYRLPLFFIESIANIIGYLFIIWFVLNLNLLKPGGTAAIYLIWYGITRISLEELRTPEDIMTIGGLHVSTFLAGLMIFGGIIMLLWFQFFTNWKGSWIQKLFSKSTNIKIKTIQIRISKLIISMNGLKENSEIENLKNKIISEKKRLSLLKTEASKKSLNKKIEKMKETLKNEKFKFKNQKKLIISNQKKSEIHSEINKLKIDIKNYRDEMNTLIYKLRDEIKNIKINLKEQKINIKKTNNNEESRKIYTHFLSNEKKLDKKIKEIQNFYENPKWLEKFKKEYILLNVESKSIVSKEEKIQKNINKKQAKLNQVQMSKETEISEKNSMEILRKNLVEIENSRKNGKISTTRIWITALEVVKKRIPIKKS